MFNSDCQNNIFFQIESKKQKQKLFLFLALFIQIIFFIIYLKFNNVLMVLGSIIILGTFFWIIFSVRNTIILLLMYISILPSQSWGSKYQFFHGLYFNEQIPFVFLALIFLWFISQKSLSYSFSINKWSLLDKMILIFLVFIFFSTLRGSFENADFSMIKFEFFFLILYVFYFIYTRILDIKQIHFIWIIFIFISITVSFEYILLAISEGSLSSILIKRVVTQQPHLAQLAIPILGSYLAFNGINKFGKIIILLAMLPLAGMVFLSQQRGLWVGVTFSIVLLYGFTFVKDQISFGKVLKFFIVLLIVVSLIFSCLLILDKIFMGSVFLTLLSRVDTLVKLSVDLSANIRISEIKRALSQWDNNFINIFFGVGLGACYDSIDSNRTYTYSVDNSYAIILWKMGIIGLIIFLIILVLFFKKGLYIFIHSKNEQFRQISVSLMSGFAGLLLIGMTNSCLVRYRFIIIWALIIATIEVLYYKVIEYELQ
jgi:hypothetical protein